MIISKAKTPNLNQKVNEVISKNRYWSLQGTKQSAESINTIHRSLHFVRNDGNDLI